MRGFGDGVAVEAEQAVDLVEQVPTRVARRGTFSKTISGTGSSFQASPISQMQRRVSSFSAWYFGVWLIFSESRPLAPLQGLLMNTASGRLLCAERRTLSAEASRQPAGGSAP
jgi:hypothetical protein